MADEKTAIPIYNIHNARDGVFSIPSSVLMAAAKVYGWMRSQPEPYGIKLNGLQLYKEGDDV